ncbi:MAG: response regulator [Desulfomonile tiedjei]|nr:response regulator [Desulfomonile tiedjei]
MALILVIDDEEDIRDLVSRILKQAGHQVLEAPDGNVGTSLYRKHLPELLITDIIMPEKEGIETIRELRQDFPNVKIIAISGGGQALPRDTCLQFAKGLGANITLAKPFSRQELLDAVQKVLETA